MNDRQAEMIAAFAEYERRDPAVMGPLHNLIGVPIGTRLLRIYRRRDHWQVWIATRDYVYGTYICLYDDGHITNTTEYQDRGPDVFEVRPTNEWIRQHEPDKEQRSQPEPSQGSQ